VPVQRTTSGDLAAIVLAAGLGKRMKSATPKVLHPVAGKPGLWHVLRAAVAARPSRLIVVVGHGRQRVEEAVRSWGLRPEPVFVDQGEPLGTAHAVLAAERAVGRARDVLVLAGDDPLIEPHHVRALLRLHRRTKASATILTSVVDDPTGYGRVVRRGRDLVRIVQESDATSEEREIREISTLVYAFRREDLFKALPAVGRDNRQHEQYLPDALAILKDKGERVAVLPVDLGGTWVGLNSRASLAELDRILRRRILDRHMAAGVTFVDPETTFVDVGVRIGRDTVVQPLTFLEGDTTVGAGCTIGPATRISDSRIDDGADVTFSVIREARVGKAAAVGPYASLRPGTIIEEGAKAGTFVEIKASRVGRRSKVPHLSYVGDATIGRDTNVGAGTVTVNYDGFAKHPTVVGDEVHIGSDTMLVAPVEVGDRAWTGAGSVITRDVPPGALAVERSEQRVVAGYDARRRAARDEGNATSRRKDRGNERGGQGRE
jgi:bifunctional UDP-N-acetylglucosamine pyrophosphorylase/glucosamine-1-phosphate N-acetyltransferase